MLSRIVDVREKPLLSSSGSGSGSGSGSSPTLIAAMVTPLVVTPGCFMLTDQRIYFQPHISVATEPVSRYNIADVQQVYKVGCVAVCSSSGWLTWCVCALRPLSPLPLRAQRRHNMRDVGLEVYLPADAAAAAASVSSSAGTPKAKSPGSGAGAGAGSAAATVPDYGTACNQCNVPSQSCSWTNVCILCLQAARRLRISRSRAARIAIASSLCCSLRA